MANDSSRCPEQVCSFSRTKKFTHQWKTMDEGSSKYNAYLCSREWAKLKRAVRKRSGGTCERCGDNPAEYVHHLTYEHKYNEQLDELSHWCQGCHDFTHGKIDVDPAEPKEKPTALSRRFLCPVSRCGCREIHIEKIGVVPQNATDIVLDMYCDNGHTWKMVINYVPSDGLVRIYTLNVGG
jgi:hypothetical protein